MMNERKIAQSTQIALDFYLKPLLGELINAWVGTGFHAHWVKGKQARRAGKPRSANPYNFETTHKGHAWDDGWKAGLLKK